MRTTGFPFSSKDMIHEGKWHVPSSLSELFSKKVSPPPMPEKIADKSPKIDNHPLAFVIGSLASGITCLYFYYILEFGNEISILEKPKGNSSLPPSIFSPRNREKQAFMECLSVGGWRLLLRGLVFHWIPKQVVKPFSLKAVQFFDTKGAKIARVGLSSALTTLLVIFRLSDSSIPNLSRHVVALSIHSLAMGLFSGFVLESMEGGWREWAGFSLGYSGGVNAYYGYDISSP